MTQKQLLSNQKQYKSYIMYKIKDSVNTKATKNHA